MSSFIRLFISIILAFACFSCAKVTTNAWRTGNTEVNAGESVVIVLGTYSLEDKAVESEGEERSIESCVGNGMRSEEEINIIPAKDFRSIVFPGKTFQEGPCTSETLPVILKDQNVQKKLAELNLRYSPGLQLPWTPECMI
jgi:hypothetical protein